MTTKDALLHAAGALFAVHGIEGTSIRAIAKESGANIAAVNYHFGSKENLYLAVIRHVLEKTRCHRSEELLKHRRDWEGKPLLCSEAVYRIVEEYIQQFFTGIHPRWYGRIFMRIFLQPTPILWEIINELVMPNFDSLREVLQCCRPGMGKEEADLWLDSFIGELMHYVFAEDFLLIIPGHRKLSDAGYQKDILRHVAKMLIRGLELPVPVFLQEDIVHA
ncbi:MAG: TetR/AcrR family transcriptional regulator [Candidatus Hydrogenedentes bacterium]|nr:TetR/AcrR family transcriptional regulator [Candidatus Hydrogenedentota bacterium]